MPPRPPAATDSVSPVQLEFAWAPEQGRLVHIAEARPGGTYLHPDPDLRLPLVPRKGFLRRHHFALHPGATAQMAGIAARLGIAGVGEGLRHLNFKLALVHRLQRGADLPLAWTCTGCGRRQAASLRGQVDFETVRWEVPFGAFRLDVGLLKNNRPVAALEVFDTHAVDPAKQQAFATAAAPFQAFELPVKPLPIRPPLDVRRTVPRLLCAACQNRRVDWLAWARAQSPAANFSGWQELPAADDDQGCIRLGGGWATRLNSSDALAPIVYWFEIRPRLDREILVTALTVHRRQGRLRWRELRLRAPQGLPTKELEYQLAHAAQDFAAAAVRFRQRLSRAEPDQLQRWLKAALTPPPAPAPPAAPTLKVSTDPSKPTPSAPLRTPPAPPPPLPVPAGRRAATWLDRLAHRAADWLENGDA